VRLSTFYDVFLVHEAHYPAWLASIGFVLVLVWIARSSREALIAVSWIVLPLLPALAGIRIFDTTDIVHDRYLYLSTIGLGMLLGLVFAKLPASGTRVFGVAPIPLAAAGAVALALLVGTVVEIQPWQSNLTLFARSVAVAPHSPAAFNHLAFEMYKRGDVPAAHRFYEQALSLDPHDWPGNFGLAVLDMRTGNLSEADQFFQRAIDLKPEVTNATYLLQGQVRLQAGHASDAERSVRRAIALWPSSTSQHLLLAQILLSQQRPEEAKVEFEKELQVDPNSAEAMEGLRSLAR
jgi:predicted TPR repeat methyltransferase